jgi:hypothetical protein
MYEILFVSKKLQTQWWCKTSRFYPTNLKHIKFVLEMKDIMTIIILN